MEIDWIVDLVATGGPVFMVLIGLSVLATTLILVKLWQFRAMRVSRIDGVADALAHHRNRRTEAGLACISDQSNPTAQTLARGLRGVDADLPDHTVREEALRYARGVLERLRWGLRSLEVIGTVAPLLGLLGTVLGMIEAFQGLEQAGNQVDPSVLSGGIWEALLTTAVGLSVAIPVVAILNGFERRIETLAHRLDDAVSQVFTPDLSGPLTEHRHP